MNYVIILVHGTWARRAPWLNQSSLLCKTLCEKLPEPIKIVPFEWTGRNSNEARQRAGKNLEWLIRKLVNDHPTAKHFIVAHSHGGNIALYALRDPALQGRVTGVICLSTPFLIFSERHLGVKAPIYMLQPFFLILLPIAIYLYNVVPIPAGARWGVPVFPENATIWEWWKHWTNVIFNILLMDFIIGACIFGLLEMAGVTSRLNPFFSMNRAIEMRKWSILPHIARTRLLILRTVGDEASGALVTAQFSGWLLSEFWRLIDYLIRKIVPNRLRNVAISALWIVIPAVIVWNLVSLLFPASIEAQMYHLIRFSYDVILAGTIPLFLIFSVVPALFLLLCLILCFVLMPFGAQNPIDSVFTEITAEVSPIGRWSVHTVPKRSQNFQTSVRFSLRHSEAYDNPRVLRLMIGWMRSQ
jgi:hypothetical protein